MLFSTLIEQSHGIIAVINARCSNVAFTILRSAFEAYVDLKLNHDSEGYLAQKKYLVLIERKKKLEARDPTAKYCFERNREEQEILKEIDIIEECIDKYKASGVEQLKQMEAKFKKIGSPSMYTVYQDYATTLTTTQSS